MATPLRRVRGPRSRPRAPARTRAAARRPRRLPAVVGQRRHARVRRRRHGRPRRGGAGHRRVRTLADTAPTPFVRPAARGGEPRRALRPRRARPRGDRPLRRDRLRRRPADQGDGRADGPRRRPAAVSSAWCWPARSGASASGSRSASRSRSAPVYLLSAQLYGVEFSDPLALGLARSRSRPARSSRRSSRPIAPPRFRRSARSAPTEGDIPLSASPDASARTRRRRRRTAGPASLPPPAGTTTNWRPPTS